MLVVVGRADGQRCLGSGRTENTRYMMREIKTPNVLGNAVTTGITRVLAEQMQNDDHRLSFIMGEWFVVKLTLTL